jgi:hypothetical protein
MHGHEVHTLLVQENREDIVPIKTINITEKHRSSVSFLRQVISKKFLWWQSKCLEHDLLINAMSADIIEASAGERISFRGTKRRDSNDRADFINDEDEEEEEYKSRLRIRKCSAKSFVVKSAKRRAAKTINRAYLGGETEFINDDDDDDEDYDEEAKYKSRLRKRSSRKRRSAKSFVAQAAGGKAANITKQADSDDEADFINDDEDDDEDYDEEAEYKSRIRKRSSRKRRSAKSLVEKSAAGRDANTNRTYSDDEAEFIDDDDDDEDNEDEEEEEEEEEYKSRLRTRSPQKRRSAKSFVAKAAKGRVVYSTKREDSDDNGAEAEFEDDWDHNPLTSRSTPRLRKRPSFQHKRHLTEPNSSESEDEFEVDEEEEDQTMASSFKEKKAHGVLYCDQCQRDRPIDNFSAMQQKELPPLPKRIMTEFPEVEPGNFRFCLVHTQGEQGNWIAQLQTFTTPATSARDEAGEGEVEMKKVARSTLMGGNYVELTEFVDSSTEDEDTITISPGKCSSSSTREIGGDSRGGGIESKGLRRMDDVIANITARERGNKIDDEDDDNDDDVSDNDDDTDDEEEEEDDATEDEDWEEEVIMTTTNDESGNETQDVEKKERKKRRRAKVKRG